MASLKAEHGANGDGLHSLFPLPKGGGLIEGAASWAWAQAPYPHFHRRKAVAPLKVVGLAVGRQRLGVNLVSLIATLREEGRLPIQTIQWYLQAVHQLKLSAGAIVRTVHHVARQAGPALREVLDRIRASPVVHADETGWREEGVNGYVWPLGLGPVHTIAMH